MSAKSLIEVDLIATDDLPVSFRARYLFEEERH